MNWMLRRLADGQLVGTVQATLYHPSAGGIEAELAWVVCSAVTTSNAVVTRASRR
ncbi:hypothetical protein [Streptomyces sp. 11-1-2]|uniref:hypothetical protein n=1 Tax=unclassified Streptomyces TaxID=2593676 RepID=UPI0019698024|nr:hypothetical protein [Streptomyces sp. 11-1-2]